MNIKKVFCKRWLQMMTVLMLCLFSCVNHAEDIHIAVASNFASTLQILADEFEQQTDHQVLLSRGSTGKQYAQIIHGAPFAIFFAADTERPSILEQKGKAIADTRFTYALGKLVLWSTQALLVDNSSEVLNGTGFRYIAIANPKLAPYGRAAQQVLHKLDLFSALQQKLVKGENINQTFQFVSSGHAQLGFIALSQLKWLTQFKQNTGSFWVVPDGLYEPIEQQAVLLKDSMPARKFIAYIKSAEARETIQQQGYELP